MDMTLEIVVILAPAVVRKNHVRAARVLKGNVKCLILIRPIPPARILFADSLSGPQLLEEETCTRKFHVKQ